MAEFEVSGSVMEPFVIRLEASRFEDITDDLIAHELNVDIESLIDIEVTYTGKLKVVE